MSSENTLAFLASIYQVPVPGSKSLADGVNEILAALKGKEADVLGKIDTQQKESSAWIPKLSGSSIDVKDVDAHLATKTYISGTVKPTLADYLLFSQSHPIISAASHAERLSYTNLTRHFNTIQSFANVSESATKFFNPSFVPIDLDDVPAFELPKEVKEKKPKKATAGEEVARAKDEKAKDSKDSGSTPTPAQEKKEKPKKEKKEQPAKSGGGGGKAAEVGPPMPHMIDLRVGKIVDVKKHPDADSLYVEQIDFGEAEGPRTVVSGLVKYVPIEEMQNRLLVGVCNLKPAAMRGVKSFAMVLCATSPEGKDAGVEIVLPPPGSVPGDRVFFEGFEDQAALEQLNPKKKQWETVQPGFTTLQTRECAWVDPNDKTKVHKIVTAKGTLTAPSYVGATLS